MKISLRWAIAPALLLALLGGIVWFNNNHFPEMTARDAQIRAQLRGTSSALHVSQWLPPSATSISPTMRATLDISSAADKADLIDHLWTNPALPVERPDPRRLEIDFADGDMQASICLGETAATDAIYISHYTGESGVGGSPPPLLSAQQYALDRASSRYFRRWLARHGVS